MKKQILLIAAILLFSISIIAYSKVDLVTLPKRDKVQITIYNSADLTLVRDARSLTMKKGLNRLQFSWANTLIDPTSLDIRALKHVNLIDIFDITYPPRVRELGLWHIRSGISGKVPIEIDYFTSGISWRAYYMGTLSDKEDNMELKGYVRVFNRSGEDYENTETRLIVGKIHLLDQIAHLARRTAPYGKPYIGVHPQAEYISREYKKAKDMVKKEARFKAREALQQAKVIRKEGLSEYFLFSIPGEETIKNGWSKRLISFSQDNIPIENLYKYEEERYGRSVRRFLYFKNDKKHKMGKEPLPGGLIKIYKTEDKEEHLSYVGADNTKYIPVKQKVELNLGNAREVKVEPKKMEHRTENYEYNRHGNVSGWEEVNKYKVKVKNMRDIDIKVEIKRNVRERKWRLDKNIGDYGKYEKEDIDTFKYTLKLEPNEEREFVYVLRKYRGTRAQNK
jgi:hypothetical protein